MNKLGILCGMLLACSATVAGAAPGVSIRWNACLGDGGVVNRTSTCASNTGTNPLVGSFELGSDIPGVTELDIVVNVTAATATLPAWWTFDAPLGVTGCRGSALAANATIPSGAINCADWAQGAAVGGLLGYEVGVFGANTARIKVIVGVPSPGVDVAAGVENFACNILVSNIGTVGTGSCAGCLTPVCLVCSSILVAPGTGPGTKLVGPMNGIDSNFATWQGGVGDPTTLCLPVPVKSRTWGEVKALYR